MTPLEQARKREANLVLGLQNLAIMFGIKWRGNLHINSLGEFDLQVSNGTAHDGVHDACGQFGEQLAQLLNRHHPRTGAYHATLIAQNGWCRMNHFDVEHMLRSVGLY